MKRYKCIFRIDHSSVTVTTLFSREDGEYKIIIPEEGQETIISITDLKEYFDNTLFHIGIRISVIISAKDIDDAAHKAQKKANYMAVILSFIYNATISNPILELGYETSETAANTEFIQYLYMNGELFKKKRTIDPFLLDNLLKPIMKYNSQRIIRAIRWYRNGLNEKDSIDKFLSYWIGLECLNKLLAKELGAEQKTIKCKKCGHHRVDPTVYGIEAIFIKYSKEGELDYGKCKGLRNEIQHGYGDFKYAVGVAGEYAELCREMLLMGLYLLLKVDQTVIDKHPMPIYNLFIPRIEFKGVYEIQPKNLSTTPYLIIDTNDIKIEIIDNKLAISFKNQIDTNIPVDMKFSSVNFIGEDGISMEIDKTELTHKDKL